MIESAPSQNEKGHLSLWKQLITSPHSTWFFQLKDKSLRKQYHSYNIQHESTLYPIVFSMTAFVIAPFYFSMAYVSRNKPHELALAIMVCIMNAAVIFLGLVIAYIRFHIDSLQRSLKEDHSVVDLWNDSEEQDDSRQTEDTHAVPLKLPTIAPEMSAQRQKPQNSLQQRQILIDEWYHHLAIVGHIYLCVFQIAVLFFAFCRNFSTVCTTSHGDGEDGNLYYTDKLPWDTRGNAFRAMLNVVFCGNVPEHYFPMDGMYVLTVSPIIMAVAFPSINIALIWMQLLSSVAGLILICVIKSHLPPATFILLWLVVNIFVVAQLQLDKIHRFYMHLQLKSLLVQNEKEAEAFHVNEMRFLIANVAHDLKTPLMSFTSAIGLIKECATELETNHVSVREKSEATMSNNGMISARLNLIDNLKECVTSLSDTNSFMLMTINRCIDYAKTAKGIKLTPKLETIDLWETLQMPVNCMKNVQDKVSIELLDLPNEMPCRHVITDRQWLQENILCLLSNAVKYSNHGKAIVKVSILRKKMKLCSRESSSSGKGIPPSYLLFEVEDNGIGVPDDLKPALFQPFKQAQRLAGGTGLGLYSLAKRIEGIQGEYGVRSRSNDEKGSVFWFTIPYRPDELMSSSLLVDSIGTMHIDSRSLESPCHDKEHSDCDGLLPCRVALSLHSPTALTKTRHLSRSTSTVDLHRKSSVQENNDLELDILLVDDAPTIVKMTSMMLRKLGHRITMAENGEVAISIVEKYWKEEGKCFDVILMDLQMPVMDGLEATKRIRSIECSSINVSANVDGIPKQLIFGVSANSDHETEEQAMKSGVDAFIAKPFTAKIFLESFNNNKIILKSTSIESKSP